MKKSFKEWLFDGMNVKDKSNKYLTCDRVNADETKIIVRVADSHLIPTRYGWALILDYSHVVFLKDWAVDQNYFGNEVMLTKQYFNVKEWGAHEEFGDDEDNLKWETWLNVAKEQDAYRDEDGHRLTQVRWTK